MNNNQSATLYCSFCGSKRGPNLRLVAGPGIYICAECIARAGELLRTPADSEPPAPSLGPAWDELSDDEIVDHLPEISRAGQQLGDQLKRWVHAARDRNISWARIGEAMGITRQSAWERFKTLD